MASIRKKDNGVWLAQVRHQATDGRPPINKSASFARKVEAEMWAAKMEAEWRAMRAGMIPDMTLGELLQRYLKEVTPTKKSQREETYRLNRLMQHPIAAKKLANLSVYDVTQWYEQRLQEISPSSANRERSTFSHAFTKAKQWGLLSVNFFEQLDKVKNNKARKRRVTDDDLEKLCWAAKYTPDTELKLSKQRTVAAFLFAIETAMRSGEILNMQWQDIDFERGFVHLPETKNGYAREVPLSKRAFEIIEQLKQVREGNQVFRVNPGTRDAQFRKMCEYVRIDDLNFHDSRHEACCRLAKVYANPFDFAKVTGHRDMNMLLNTYYNKKGEELAKQMQEHENK